jgi:heptosyltransferase-2
MCAPAFAAIREATPGAERVAQVRPAFLPLAALLPGVTGVLPAGKDRGPRELARSRQALEDGGFDAAVVFPRSLRAAVAPWLAGIPVRIGFGDPIRRRLLTHPIEGWRPWRAAHRSVYYGLVARPFGDLPAAGWRLEAPAAALEAADRLLASLGRRPGRPLVAFEPGASYGSAKCWPAASYGALARRLAAERDADVVTVGNDAARALEEQVAAVAGPGLLRAAGRTEDLSALIGLLARADLVVSNDTGPMHLAAALGRPVVALFGASDPGVSAPRGPAEQAVLYEPEACSPCFLRECDVPGHPCLAKIPVERVLSEALRLLG